MAHQTQHPILNSQQTFGNQSLHSSVRLYLGILFTTKLPKARLINWSWCKRWKLSLSSFKNENMRSWWKIISIPLFRIDLTCATFKSKKHSKSLSHFGQLLDLRVSSSLNSLLPQDGCGEPLFLAPYFLSHFCARAGSYKLGRTAW